MRRGCLSPFQVSQAMNLLGGKHGQPSSTETCKPCVLTPIWREENTDPALPEAVSKTQASTVSYNKGSELKKKKRRQKECDLSYMVFI